MSRASLVSVSACVMCPAAAPSERDTAMAAGGARAGRGYHVALHTPRAFTAPVDYHPTALLIGADSSHGTWFPAESLTPGGAEEPGHGHSVYPPDGNGRPGPDQHHLIPASRSHSTLSEGHSDGPQPVATPVPTLRPAAGDDPAVMNDAYTWHAPEYLRISGELCSYMPWNSTGTGLTTADGHVLEAAPLVPGPLLGGIDAPLADSDSPIAGNPAVVRQFTPEPPRRHRHRRAKPAFPAVRYAAGGALLLVIAALLARRRRLRACRSSRCCFQRWGPLVSYAHPGRDL